MKYFYRLHNTLLHEDELEISHLDAASYPIDNKFEISIYFVFQLNNPEKFDKIVEQFDALTLYMDSISQN
jgi:hypothetical protein